MAIFLCDECGEPAATVYFVPPFVEDPRVDHGSGHEDPGAGSIELRAPRISFARGPVPVTISAAGDWADAAATALRRRDAKMLSEIDREFVPFWCIRCERSYCKNHWQTSTSYDAGFFDCVEGVCPRGHRQVLMDQMQCPLIEDARNQLQGQRGQQALGLLHEARKSPTRSLDDHEHRVSVDVDRVGDEACHPGGPRRPQSRGRASRQVDWRRASS